MEQHCEDCLAYVSEGYLHVCPPWLKSLVTCHKQCRPLKDKES